MILPFAWLGYVGEPDRALGWFPVGSVEDKLLQLLCTHAQLTITLRQKEQTAEECRNTYILQLEKCNAFRRNHLDSDMPSLFSEFQDMNARRINKYKELLGQFSECHRRVQPVVNTCLDNITKASDEVNAEEVGACLVDSNCR